MLLKSYQDHNQCRLFPTLHDAVTAGTGGTGLLLGLCVHANICSARYTESQLTVRRPIWHPSWATAGVRSDIAVQQQGHDHDNDWHEKSPCLLLVLSSRAQSGC